MILLSAWAKEVSPAPSMVCARGKLNLADMRRTVRDVMVRDTKEGTVYPDPIAQIPCDRRPRPGG